MLRCGFETTTPPYLTVASLYFLLSSQFLYNNEIFKSLMEENEKNTIQKKYKMKNRIQKKKVHNEEWNSRMEYHKNKKIII